MWGETVPLVRKPARRRGALRWALLAAATTLLAGSTRLFSRDTRAPRLWTPSDLDDDARAAANAADRAALAADDQTAAVARVDDAFDDADDPEGQSAASSSQQ